jgi:Xaa-Pro aminopeptidase
VNEHHVTPADDTTSEGGQARDPRLTTSSHDQPVPEAYAAFMRQGWGERDLEVRRHPVADWAETRRARLADMFPGERLVVPAGNFKVRSNDTDYRFRADTAHVYLTGNQTSDAVLVLEDGEAVLYARPRSSRRCW